MTLLIMVVCVVLGALFQEMLPCTAWLGQAKVPIMVAIVLYYAMYRNAAAMLGAAVIAGVCFDAMSAVPLGYSAVCLCAVGWGVMWFRKVVPAEAWGVTMLLGAVAAAAFVLGDYLLLLRIGLVAHPFGWVLLKLVGTALLGAIATPVVLLVVGGVDRLVGNVELRETIDVIEYE